jgi:hypothetical protein
MNNDINELKVARAQVCENPLYNSWYALWTPVIQPALGILMLGVVLQVPPPPPLPTVAPTRVPTVHSQVPCAPSEHPY